MYWPSCRGIEEVVHVRKAVSVLVVSSEYRHRRRALQCQHQLFSRLRGHNAPQSQKPGAKIFCKLEVLEMKAFEKIESFGNVFEVRLEVELAVGLLDHWPRKNARSQSRSFGPISRLIGGLHLRSKNVTLGGIDTFQLFESFLKRAFQSDQRPILSELIDLRNLLKNHTKEPPK